ncbi:MAG: hypothetical protein ABI856_07930 [Nitrospira sp.]
MRTVDFWLRMLSCWVIFLLGTMIGAWAEEPSRFLPGDGQPVGVVMGISGGPVSIASAGPASRTVKVGDLIAAGEELHVGAGAKVDVLWDHRALLTLHEEARLHIQEPHHGQTEVRLHNGTVRIALSYNAGRMTDRLTLQTALARLVSRGGVLEATVVKDEQRSLFARLMNGPAVDTLRVFEGQARIEPLTGEGKPFSLKTGSEVSFKSGTAPSISEMPSDTRRPQPLAVKAEHRESPTPITRQIINAHVSLALESEKELQRIPTAGGETELTGTTTKGAILATSIGFPFISGAQASVAGNSTGGPSFSTSPSVLSPPVVSPIQGAGAGIGPAQSGGLNSSGLLKQILHEVGKGAKGQGKK